MRAETSNTQCLEGGLVQSSSSITICNWIWNKKPDRNFISWIWHWRCHKGKPWSSALLPVALDFNARSLTTLSLCSWGRQDLWYTSLFSECQLRTWSRWRLPGRGGMWRQQRWGAGYKIEEFPTFPSSRLGCFMVPVLLFTEANFLAGWSKHLLTF